MFKRHKSHTIAINNISMLIKEITNSYMIGFDVFKSTLPNINYELKFKQVVNIMFFSIFV